MRDGSSRSLRAAWPLLALLPVLAAGALRAETWRCTAADGSVRFTDVPSTCGDPVRHVPSARVERAPAAGPPAEASSPPGGRPLESLLIGADAAGGGFEAVREVPGDPGSDPDLVEWGVRAQAARHYTRDRAGTVEVCSVELWSFASLEQAAAAAAHFHYPGWRIDREGTVLVMVRGLRRPPDAPPRRGVFPDCAGIGARVRERARP